MWQSVQCHQHSDVYYTSVDFNSYFTQIIIIMIIIFAFVSRRNVVTSEAATVTVYREYPGRLRVPVR